MRRSSIAKFLSFLLWTGVVPLHAAEPAPPVVQLLSDVLKIDTSNPPGNEGKMAAFLTPAFKAAGFEVDIVPTPQPGKAHFIARLRGDGSKRPVLIAAHADVVGVEREKWSVDPFAGVVKDGYIYGRGAIDFKGGLAVFAQAALDIARITAQSGTKLKRDLILLVEADEEGGLYGTSFLAEKVWDKIDCEFALNEGGWIIRDGKGKVQYVSISTADKANVSLLLRAKGTSTHSSMPLPDNAIYRLARTLTKLSAYDTRVRLNDSTKQFFLTLSRVNEEPMKTHFRNLVQGNEEQVKAADQAISSSDALLHAIMRNTIAPVLLNGGFRGNVIPGSAEATINFRIIPGTTVAEVIDEISTVINDPMVEVTQARMSSMLPSNMTPEQKAIMDKRIATMQDRKVTESPQNTELYAALEKHSKLTYPGALVTPYLFQAGTDAYAWRSRNIPVYGIYPYPITLEDLRRMHGNDERVPVDSLLTGLKLITSTILEVAR